MFVRSLRVLTIVALAVLPTACSSLDHALFQDKDPVVMYGGTTYSWNYITGNTSEETTIVGNIAYTLDFPLTVGMDTLILPITAPIELTR